MDNEDNDYQTKLLEKILEEVRMLREFVVGTNPLTHPKPAVKAPCADCGKEFNQDAMHQMIDRETKEVTWHCGCYKADKVV